MHNLNLETAEEEAGSVDPHSTMSKKLKMMKKVESLTDLPPNIVVEILTRLPLETLYVSQSVCTTFLNLSTLDSHFMELHTSNAPPSLIFHFLENSYLHSVRMLEPEIHKFDYRPIFDIPKPRISIENKFGLVNSCKGLLYFCFKHIQMVANSLLCNPVTNEHTWVRILDSPHSEIKSQWLGFDSTTNVYKVLRIFVSPTAEMSSEVFELHSGTPRSLDLPFGLARNIGNTPLGPGHSWEASNTFVNGVIHWLDPSQKNIVWFDFEKEVFGEVALPGEAQRRIRKSMCIGVLEGLLSLSYYDSSANRVEVWVMEKHERWSKKYVVDAAIQTRRQVSHLFKPLQILSNGELLMLWNRKSLVCHDLKRLTFRCVALRQNLNADPVVFSPTFISLRVALRVDEVSVQSVRPRLRCLTLSFIDHVGVMRWTTSEEGRLIFTVDLGSRISLSPCLDKGVSWIC